MPIYFLLMTMKRMITQHWNNFNNSKVKIYFINRFQKGADEKNNFYEIQYIEKLKTL